MPLQKFSRIRTTNEDIENLQSTLAESVNPAIVKVILDGILTDTLALTTSYQNLPHGLGREPLGWFVVAPDANATVYKDATSANNPDSTLFLRIRGSAAVNCKLWVF